MTQSPIRRVLSTIHKHRVSYLLMGGQACVLYGAAEFSRDVDLALEESPPNLELLQAALNELNCRRIAVPPFNLDYLKQGLAVHFRSDDGMRVDVMTRMRGVDEFSVLWQRRTTLEFVEHSLEVMGLPDLVQAKKTQRDKDWPMLARLVQSHYFSHRGDPNPEQVKFWLQELRSPELLQEVVASHPEQARHLIRPAVQEVLEGNDPHRALWAEEQEQREADRVYWEPLRRELEKLRRERA